MAYFQSKPTAGRHFLQIPGPSNVPDRVLRAIDNPTMDHRGPDFGLFGKALLEKTRHVFKTQGPVVIYPASGTGAWEAALVNTLSAGDRVLMVEQFRMGPFARQDANPWTLEPIAGMVDAAVGGKTGINSEYGKNLIGAFNSPKSVPIDTSWLSTLSDRDFAAGLAEVVKCGFIKDVEILNLLKGKNLPAVRKDLALTTELIERSVKVKGAVVSVDFKESFEREVLNYGHTLGHAIEKHARYQLRHGEAVAIGMVFVAELAFARGLIDVTVLELHRNLLNRFDLPITFQRDAWQKLAPLLALDKKARGTKIRFVALHGIGATVRLDDLSSSELDAAYERISS